jgi:YbbR domain-containing protein
MRTRSQLNRSLSDNLIWLLGSLVLALLVWVIASFQSDPIVEQRFPERLAVQMTPDAGLLLTSPPQVDRQTSLVVRAPRSVLDLLTAEEIEVWADLSGLGPGEHTVELQARLARQPARVVNMSPRLMRVVLEEASARQVALRAVVTAEPPTGFSRDEPRFDVSLNQVLVSGPASRVNEVVAAQASLDLSQQRSPFEANMRLSPVNAEGATVEGVTLDPQLVTVSVNIRRRDDVREVSVRPTILGTPPDGYVLNSLTYSPQAVLISGSPSQLANLPDILPTEPIDLTDRTASFELSIPVVLPDAELLLLTDQTVTVSVEINPLTTSRQFEGIPVEVIGLGSGLIARSVPNQVTVLITGPQPELEALEASDIRVTADVNGLNVGMHPITPTVSIRQRPMPTANISVLPTEIDVEITDGPTPAPGTP